MLWQSLSVRMWSGSDNVQAAFRAAVEIGCESSGLRGGSSLGA
jgi:hypothetical protein